MSKFLQMYAQSINGDPTYAWIITEDKIDDGDSVGVAGPSDAPDDLLNQDGDGTWDFEDSPDIRKRYIFRLYDDDGIHYFTGKLVTKAETPEHDETGPNGALMAPLTEYGEAFGCTRIAWHEHPEWEIG